MIEAKVEQQNGIFIVNLIGKLDFESADSLKDRCLRALANQPVIFNMRQLNFVGSSGITPFLELLSAMSKSAGRNFKLCAVSAEFMRLFESGSTDGIEIYNDVQQATRAFTSADVQAIAMIKPFGLGLTLD